MNISKEQGLLIAYGGRPYIPPREVHKDFFAHIGFNAFKASGVRCELPFPIFRQPKIGIFRQRPRACKGNRRQGRKGKIGISEIPVLMQDGGIRGCGTSPLI